MKTTIHLLTTLLIGALSVTTLTAETYTYDEAGRLTRVSYDNESFIEYTYDNAGNITSVVMSNPSSVPNPGDGNVGLELDVDLRSETTSISLRSTVAGDGLIVIRDLFGRPVQVLYKGTITRGELSISRNLTTENGNPLPAGPYFIDAQIRRASGEVERTQVSIVHVR